jgi:hypothetical protein
MDFDRLERIGIGIFVGKGSEFKANRLLLVQVIERRPFAAHCRQSGFGSFELSATEPTH